MMYYNRKTGALSSVPPWGAAFLVPKIRKARFPDWEEVDDGFVPKNKKVELSEPETSKADIELAEALIEIYSILEERK